MVGGDGAEGVAVIDEGAEVIDALDHDLARWHGQHGAVIGRVAADQHVIAPGVGQPLHDARQHRGANLGATTSAAHGDGRQLADGIGVGDTGGQLGFFVIRRHLRQLVELAHEALVDPVLDRPQPGRFVGPVATRGDGVLVAGTDQAKEIFLRAIAAQRPASRRRLQVIDQHRSLAHREDARLGARIGQRGNIAGGEDVVV